MTGQRTPRRAGASLAILLVALLVLHHTVMALMPMPIPATSGQDTASAMSAMRGQGMASATPSHVRDATGRRGMASAAYHVACPLCGMVCPPTQGSLPARPTAHASSPASPATGGAPCGDAPIAPSPSFIGRGLSTRAMNARARGRAPSPSARQALLEMYLL
jgi:hypothetical protein